MFEKAINILAEKACASIRYRTRKEILDENPDINDYLDDIQADTRVKYVFTWQKPGGYLGQCFHGGWIPEVKSSHFGTGAEAGLRFLAEMGLPKDHPVVEKALKALLKDDWNVQDIKWSWASSGMDDLRALIFSYFGIVEHEFIQTAINRTLGTINKISGISSISEITGTYKNRLYYNKDITLPGIYNFELLAFTNSWRSKKNINAVVKALEHFISLSPLPATIYKKIKSQLIALGNIAPRDYRKSPGEFLPGDWFQWLRVMESFVKMGVINKLPVLASHINELKNILAEGGGFFTVKTETRPFRKWGVNNMGLALEENWKNESRKFDLTFRSLLILKYAELL